MNVMTIVGRTLVVNHRTCFPYALRQGTRTQDQPRGCVWSRVEGASPEGRYFAGRVGRSERIHRTCIRQLERGGKSPSLRTLFNLAGTLDVAPSAIVRGVERAT